MVIPYQIYRHFKGHICLVLSVALEESTLEPKVIYMHLNDKREVWSRTLSEFESLVPEGKDNPTGQKHRFELINNIQSTLGHCTTENLIKEIKSRPDNPFSELDIEGFNDKVAIREYIVGELKSFPDDQGYVLQPLFSADSFEEAKGLVERHFDKCSSRTKIFKSVLIEVESFD